MGLPKQLRAAGVRASRPVPIVLSINTFALGGLRFFDTGSMIFVMCGCVWEDDARVQQVATPA